MHNKAVFFEDKKMTPWMESRILLINAVSILNINIKPDGIEPSDEEAISVLSELLEEEELIRFAATRLLRRVPGS